VKEATCTHQQKKLNEEELIHFRDRFNIPVSDEEIAKHPFTNRMKTAKKLNT
jgi:pyruvate dehydrogenase complex dehydrogenase (E1) component